MSNRKILILLYESSLLFFKKRSKRLKTRTPFSISLLKFLNILPVEKGIFRQIDPVRLLLLLLLLLLLFLNLSYVSRRYFATFVALLPRVATFGIR